MALFATAHAEPDLFVAETAVADETGETRNAALAQMLGEVMVRVSGSAAVKAQPGAKPVLAAAPSLVQQFRYRVSEGENGLEKTLWARFDAASVERMMRQNGLPVWRQRPRVLIWVATERGSQRELLNLDNEPEARAAVEKRADYRGLPLQLPLMDLTDQGSLTPADVWSDYRPAIQQASARYPHDQVAVGRLGTTRTGEWRGNWTLYQGDDARTFTTTAKDLAGSLAAAVDAIQDQLAARYAPVRSGDGSSGTSVRFSGVDDLSDYARLAALLQGLEPVTAAVLRRADRDVLWFDLSLRGDAGDLRRSLDASAEVIAEPGASSAADTGRDPAAVPVVAPVRADLYYRLRD